MDSNTRELVVIGLRYAGLLGQDAPVPSDADLIDMIAQFQLIRGIESDGKAGNVTLREMGQLRFCAVPDRVSGDGSRCRWDHTTWDGTKFVGPPKNLLLTWHVTNPESAKLPKEVVLQAFGDALGRWAEVAALEFAYVEDPSKANLTFGFGKIDGPSSTLAYQYLPCGPDGPKGRLQGLYDDKEAWVYYPDGPAPASKIDLAVVAAHEGGHGLGLEHGPGGALLAPTYDRNVRVPQEWDKKEIQIRYGPKILSPTEPPVPAVGKIVVEMNGAKYNTDEVRVTVLK